MAFKSTFGILRSQCPTPTIALTSGGNLAAGSAYLWVNRQNRAGFDTPAALGLQTWSAGQKIVITLPTTMRGAGESVHRIWILAADTNNPAIAFPLAVWRGVSLQAIGGSGFFSEVQTALPATVELSRPEQVIVGGAAANPTSLAAMGYPIDGMIRFITSLNGLFVYDSTSTKTVNATTVLSAGSNAGRWLPWYFPQTFGIGSITDTTGDRGANRDTRSLLDADILVPPPNYRMDGTASTFVSYCLLNGVSETGDAIEAGQRVLLNVFQDGAAKSQLFSRRVIAVVMGAVRLSDGTLTTTGMTVGQELTFFYGEALYTLEQPLAPGYGLLIRLAFKFRKEELDGTISTNALSTQLFFSKQAGNFFPGSEMFGSAIIYPSGGLRRVYPKRGLIARVASGAGMVSGISFGVQPAFDLTLPTANASSQKITLNGDGSVFYRGAIALDTNEVLRAVVELAVGRSNPSTYSSYSAIAASGGLSITVTYPTTIRVSYPDSAIAGANVSLGFEMNAPYVVLYLQRQSSGEIREFPNNAVLSGAATQTFSIASFTSGTVIASLPNTSGDFGFWSSTPAPAAAAISGSFAADSYRVAWGFRYDGTTLSGINHGAAGCVPENRVSIGELSNAVAALQAAIAGWQNGSTNIDVLDLLVRGVASFAASNLVLNSDAAQSGVDWKYTVASPDTGMSANQTIILPANAGQPQQALIGNGAGVLQYASVIRPIPVPFAFDAASSSAFFTLPAGDYLRQIECQIVTAWNGTAPTIAIGISGNTGKYIASDIIDLKSAAGGLYRLSNRFQAPVANESILFTYSAGGATYGNAIFIAHFFG